MQVAIIDSPTPTTNNGGIDRMRGLSRWITVARTRRRRRVAVGITPGFTIGSTTTKSSRQPV
jgi:hypothetical protein